MARKICFDLALLLILAGTSVSRANSQNQAPMPVAGRPAIVLSAVPLNFEPNLGQADRHVQFLSRGSGYSLFLTPGEVVLNLERQNSPPSSKSPSRIPDAAPVD